MDPLWKRVEAMCGEEPRVLAWGLLPLPDKMPHADLLTSWLASGFHADMEWMAKTQNLRMQPQQFEPTAKSVLLVLWKSAAALQPLDRAISIRVAAYAQGEDYHLSLGGWLHRMAAELRKDDPMLVFRPFSDAQPVPERELAQMAGLGWIGKNRMLIHSQLGSNFVLGGLLCNVAVEDAQIHPSAQNFCGSCTRCIEACPTHAIHSELGVDARQCISATTIEHRGEFSAAQAAGIGNWLFGCDICQSVCPWNHKQLAKDNADPYWPVELEAWEHLLTPGNGLKSRIKGTPLERAGRKLLARNLVAVSTNLCR